MDKEKYTHLIFDLGGVIINLDIPRTFEQLGKLMAVSTSEALDLPKSEKAFELYEKGLISDDQFRQAIRKLCNRSVSDEEIDLMWNAMILDLPPERLELLKKLRSDYSVSLLSNTNAIHMREVMKQVQKAGFDSFDPFFDHQYYSHLLHERKPDAAIYQIVLDDNNLGPEETLFFDDTIPNLDGAAKLGIHTFHVPSPDAVKHFFDE